MPFVVGIMPSSVPEMMTLPMEEVLIVDVDNNCFLQKPSFVDDYQLLPSDFWTPVRQAVKDAAKSIKSKHLLAIRMNRMTHIRGKSTRREGKRWLLRT